MRNKINKTVAATLCCFALSGSPAASAAYYQGNPFIEAMRLMMEMFLSMGQGGNFYPPGYGPPNTFLPGAQPWSPSVTPFSTPDNPILDGTWVSHNGFILVVAGPYARIAVDYDEFMDFYIRYKPDVLQLRDGQSQNIATFQLWYQNNRMGWRDEADRVLLFKKIRQNPFR
ncbi:MAG: hypothetical protein ACWA5Q_03080 [bacterium]